MKVQKGDKIVVIKGSEKGSEGEVVKVYKDINKVLVKGINLKTVYKKTQDKKEMVKEERPFQLSNVAIVDPKTKKPTRVGFEGKGKDKKRVTKKSKTKLSVSKK